MHLHIDVDVETEEVVLHAVGSWAVEVVARGCGCRGLPGLKGKLGFGGGEIC